MSKSALRQRLRQQRAELSAADRRHAARRAARHLLRTRAVRQARHVAVYLHLGHELSTAPLIDALHAQGKYVYVPQVRSHQRLRFVPLLRGAILRRRAYGIAEPIRQRPQRTLRRMDVVLLPLVGFDDDGVRLGNGGGYYDRALAFSRPLHRPRLIGYAYTTQHIPTLPADAWDTRLDAVVTERGLILFDR